MDFDTEFENVRARFERFLHVEADSWRFPEPLGEAARYALLSGGKRIRPVIFLKAYEEGAQIDEPALFFAAAIECMHAYSLVHDDLPCMDDDDFRRGMPTVHKKFGENIAVLTGDALQNCAFRLAVRAAKCKGTASALAAAETLAALTGGDGLVGGQVADIAFDATAAGADELVYVYAHKTCDLIVAAAKCGALLSGANDDAAARLAELGYNFGFAFQLADDLIDGESGEGCSALRLFSAAEVGSMLAEYTDRAINAAKGLKNEEFFAELIFRCKTRKK